MFWSHQLPGVPSSLGLYLLFVFNKHSPMGKKDYKRKIRPVYAFVDSRHGFSRSDARKRATFSSVLSTFPLMHAMSTLR